MSLTNSNCLAACRHRVRMALVNESILRDREERMLRLRNDRIVSCDHFFVCAAVQYCERFNLHGYTKAWIIIQQWNVN